MNSNGSVIRVWGVVIGFSFGLVYCFISGGDGKMDIMIGDGRS